MSFPTTFDVARVTREDIVEWSVFTFIQTGLQQIGIPPAMLGYLESFNTNIFEGPVTKSYIAPGFHQNDGGHVWELGSNLRRKSYTFEYWIIGLNATQGRNLSHLVEQLIEANTVIPVFDITQPQPYPIVGALEADEQPSNVQRAVVGNPEPWQQHLYCAYVKVVDFYYDAATGPMFQGYDGGVPWAGPIGDVDGGTP